MIARPRPPETAMAEAFAAAGYKPSAPPETAKERLELMMVKAIAANNGIADPTIDTFIKLLLAEDDAELIWTLVEDVRMSAIRHLHGIVHFRIQQQRPKAARPQQQNSGDLGNPPPMLDSQQAAAAQSPETSPAREGAVWKPNWTMPASPPPSPPPLRPTSAVGEAMARHSRLDMLIGGRALGDLNPEEAAKIQCMREIDARFIKLLISRLPPDKRHRIRDFISAEEADKLYAMAQDEVE